MLLNILISIAVSIITAIIKYLLKLPQGSIKDAFQVKLWSIQEDIKNGKADAAHIKQLSDLLTEIKHYRDSQFI